MGPRAAILAALLLAAPVGAIAQPAADSTAAPADTATFAPDSTALAAVEPPSSAFRIELLPTGEDDETFDDDEIFDARDAGRDMAPPPWWMPDSPTPRATTSWLRYNRVEGFTLALRFDRALDGTGFAPSWAVGLGLATAADKGVWEAAVEQPLLRNQKLTLGLEGYRYFDSFTYGDDIIGNGENTASSLFLGKDYRDWYEAEGGSVWLGLRTSPFFFARFGYTARDESAAPVNATWSLFNNSDPTRPNPRATEGQWRAWDAQVTYDSRPRRKRSGDLHRRSTWGWIEYYARGFGETGGGGLGGDFDAWRLGFDGRTYLRLTPDQDLTLRILAATGENRAGGPLDPQRAYALGGIGTMRGHDFRSLVGDHAALANLVYAFHVFGASQALVTVDAGTAWSEGSLFDQKIGVDVGGGLQLGESGISALVAKTVNRSGSDVKLVIRLQSAF